MSATTFPVVSPRKGKHARSGGLTFSQPAASWSDAAASTSFSSFSTPAATAVFPSGLDPLTLDADEAFIRFSVREVQSMEGNLQSSHDQLSSKLKGLVSDRYRDMLGTANTLIEMSTSATNLVRRLDSVRQGVTSVKDPNGGRMEDDKDVSPSGDETIISQGDNMDDKDKTNVLAIAAATKLLAEAPDELWRAIESASYSSKTSRVFGKQRGFLSWREWSDFKAASALKAAWIYILCERAWNWLSVEVEATSLFPYVSKQWHSIISFKAEIARVSHAGLAGWFTLDKIGVTRWEDMSSTYISTATFALGEALLDKQSLISLRDALLSERRKAIEEHLTKTANSATTTIARTIRCIADTIIHCLQAFYPGENEQQSKGLSMANLFKSVSSPLEAYGTFPPHARQILVSLPTGEVLVEHLPVEVRMYAPALSREDAQKCHDTTLSTLRAWCEALRVAGRESFFKSSVERLDTISAVGEAQIQIRRAVDRSISLLQRAIKDMETRHSMEEEVRLFAEILEGALVERVDALCRQRAAELSLAVCESTTSALKNLNNVHQSSTGTTKTHKEQEMERTPIKFVFQSDNNDPDVKGKLRLQTPLVKQVLASVEEKAKTLATEIESYSAFVESDASRRKKRKQRKDEPVERQGHESSAIEEQVGKVLDSYRTAFDGARLALVDELRRQLGLQAHISGDQRAVQHLLIARIASALQRSTVLRSATTVAAKSNDAVFQQGLADLRAQVISGWVIQMVEEAIAGYAASIERSVESAGDDDHGRPTPYLAEALLKLVDGIDAAGCGQQSEASALGRQVLSAFVAAWVQMDAPQQEKQRDCFMSDSLILLTLVREYENEAEKEADQLAHLVGDALASQSHPSIETGIQRLRLVLHPLRCPQVNRVADRKTPSEAAPPPCPPLPMVKLVSAREKVALF